MKQPKCETCEFYRWTTTLKSKDKPVWHCRDGFKPHNDKNGCCVDNCKRNDQIVKERNILYEI